MSQRSRAFSDGDRHNWRLDRRLAAKDGRRYLNCRAPFVPADTGFVRLVQMQFAARAMMRVLGDEYENCAGSKDRVKKWCAVARAYIDFLETE